MAHALPVPHPPDTSPPRIACCIGRADDALQVATAAALVAAPGLVFDVGCGAGGIAIPLLQARWDLRVSGVEVDPVAAAHAETLARRAGVADRLSIAVADVLAAELPRATTATVNPPMLPGEPGCLVAGTGGTRPFAHAMVERLAGIPSLTDIWIHLFDFWGVDVPYGDHPTLASTAAAAGFEIGYPHRGWRSIGAASAIRAALPELARLCPAAPVRIDGGLVPMAEVPPRTPGRLHIRHTIARLHRPVTPEGVLP